MAAPLVCVETGRNAGPVPSPLLHRPPGLYHDYDDDDYDGDYDELVIMLSHIIIAIISITTLYCYMDPPLFPTSWSLLPRHGLYYGLCCLDMVSVISGEKTERCY